MARENRHREAAKASAPHAPVPLLADHNAVIPETFVGYPDVLEVEVSTRSTNEETPQKTHVFEGYWFKNANVIVWRPICYAYHNYNTQFSISAEPSNHNLLQFPHTKIVEWIEEIKASRGGSNAKVARYLGVSPSFVSKFLVS